MTAALELIAILLGLKTFILHKDPKSNNILRMQSDSNVSKLALGSWKAKSPVLSFMLREIALVSVVNDIEIHCAHLAGTLNEYADAISRAPWHKDKQWIMNMLNPNLEQKFDLYKESFWLQNSREWPDLFSEECFM